VQTAGTMKQGFSPKNPSYHNEIMTNLLSNTGVKVSNTNVKIPLVKQCNNVKSEEAHRGELINFLKNIQSLNTKGHNDNDSTGFISSGKASPQGLKY
jgi:hypothetical protein